MTLTQNSLISVLFLSLEEECISEVLICKYQKSTLANLSVSLLEEILKESITSLENLTQNMQELSESRQL